MKIFSLNPILDYENKEAEGMPDSNQFQSGSDESRSMCKKRTDAITQSKCPTDFHASPLCCTLFHWHNQIYLVTLRPTQLTQASFLQKKSNVAKRFFYICNTEMAQWRQKS